MHSGAREHKMLLETDRLNKLLGVTSYRSGTTSEPPYQQTGFLFMSNLELFLLIWKTNRVGNKCQTMIEKRKKAEK